MAMVSLSKQETACRSSDASKEQQATKLTTAMIFGMSSALEALL